MYRFPVTLAVASLVFSTAVAATIRSWPSPQCNTTLQACIDSSVTGDVVRVVQLADVDENLTITRNIELQGNPRLTLRSGRNIEITLNSAAEGDSVFVNGVRFKGGRIDATQTGAGTVTRRVTIRDVTADTLISRGSVRFLVYANQTGTAPFAVTLSRVQVDVDASGFTEASGIVTASKSGPVSGSSLLKLTVLDSVFRFRRATRTSGIQMIDLASAQGDSDLEVLSNTFVGSGYGVAINARAFNEGNHRFKIAHNAIDQFANGVQFFALDAASGSGGLDNNTITRHSGIAFDQFGSTTSTIQNNIFANGNCAFRKVGGAFSATRNLVFATTNSDVNCQLAGSTELRTFDPRFVNLATGDTRLRADSPARNDGRPLTGASFDADGQSRNVDPFIDLGAFETNEEVQTVTPSASNTTANYVTLPPNLFSIPPVANAALFASAASKSNPPLWPTQGNLGVFFQNNQWNVFDQLLASSIGANGRFHVNHVSGGNTILARADSSAGNFFLINDPRINSNPDARLIVTPNWNPFGIGIYDNHAIAVRYDNPNDKWAIYHPDGTLPPFNAYYNVLIASSHLTQAVFQSQTPQAPPAIFGARINLPLLNDNPCAAPLITRVPSGLSDATTPVLLQYVQEVNGGYWYAVNSFEASNPIGVNVYFNGAQAKRCLLDGFGDGFE
jgi:hypothetical protein